MSCFVTLPALLNSQEQAELFNLASALLTMQDNLLVRFLCRCQKDLRLFSLAEQTAPFGFQAVLLQLGGSRRLGHFWAMLQPLAGRLLPWRDINYITCWAVCTFPLPKASWTDWDISTTPNMPTNSNPTLFGCSYLGLMSPNYAMPGKSSSQIWRNCVVLSQAPLCFFFHRDCATWLA